MNIDQMDAVLDIARRQGIGFDAAADRYMLYGTEGLPGPDVTVVDGKTLAAVTEREQGNAEVDRRKAERKMRRRG